MGSDSKKPPRPKHRFSFSGQNKQPEASSTRAANITKGDILNSLTKHAHPLESEARVPETERAVQFQEPDQTTVPARARNRGSARGALVIFLGGFLAVWLYGYVTGAYEIPYLRGVTESPVTKIGVQLVSSNPILSGAVAASALIGALYIWHRKRI
ncbi:MAG: hypothetical protein AUI50_03335 [Crenarchaeota archaeon 13_1_40CM_2_52_14]|nr:MAG: hypothetical protein AUI97_09690 [Crenarchaeota archaeon 13_1_40CM_3_52_17]OLD35164.1 MAG: hypothetical protein AUI50_03335 [Crenarchaeota archaeon 13_1_40CM_2_52_14]OLE69685.1 MAG: hypothetical protein AUF78_09960 [archaeon 13_1_20CM_2_51_12]